MIKTMRWASLAVALLLVVSACGDSDSDSEYGLVSEGKLTVCTDAPYPPMEFEQDGEFTGFDMELMRAIAGELDLEMTVFNSGFNPITSGAAMVAGDCDIAAASITITATREENIDFSDPYFNADQSLLTKKDSGVSSLADVAGERLAVQTGTTGAAYAEENAPSDTAIVEFDDPGDLFLALEAGDVVGVLQDIVVNQDRADNDSTVTVVATFPTDEFYGFAVKETGSEALLEAVNEALATLRSNGTYDDIYNDWFVTG